MADDPRWWRRVCAFPIDWAYMLVWIALVAAVGIPLYRLGVIELDSSP